MPCCELWKHLRQITPDDLPLFRKYLKSDPREVNELSINNLFSWSEIVHHLWCEWEGHLLISFRDGDDCTPQFYPPIGPDPAAVMRKGLPALKHYRWRKIEAKLAEQLKDQPLQTAPDNPDFVYDVEELRTVAGKKFDGKRNFIKRFGAYEPEVRALTQASAQECLQIQEEWLQGQGQNSPSAIKESTTLAKAIQHFDLLGLFGVGVYVKGEMAAFAIGERVSETLATEHYEKALPDLTGAYPFTLNAFVKSLPAGVTELNREDDLGIEALRKSKLSWQPVRMVAKSSWDVNHG